MNKGNSSCGHCDVCEFADDKSRFLLPNGKWHSTKCRVTCQTPGVIYLAQCFCGGFYIGKTKRQYFKCIRDYIEPIKKRKMDTAIGRHVGIEHDFNPHTIKFLALEHVPLDERGGQC